MKAHRKHCCPTHPAGVQLEAPRLTVKLAAAGVGHQPTTLLPARAIAAAALPGGGGLWCS